MHVSDGLQSSVSLLTTGIINLRLLAISRTIFASVHVLCVISIWTFLYVFLRLSLIISTLRLMLGNVWLSHTISVPDPVH